MSRFTRAYSYSFLVWSFLARQVRRVFRGRKDDGGLPRLLLNFSPEGIKPLTLADEALLAGLSRCIHCGLCEAVCDAPIDRLTAFSRTLAMANEALASLPEPHCPAGCDRCAQICPTAVPLAEIRAFLARRAR